MTRNQRSVVCPASVFAKATPDRSPDEPPACPAAAPRSRLRPLGFGGQAPLPAPRASAAFTVLELLVVISIIAILLGVILPAFLKVRDNAKYTKARVTAKNLETAFKNYLDYYRTWPSVFDVTDTLEIKDNIFKIMRGENTANVVFYEFESTNEATGALDPWSDPDPLQSSTWQRYWVRVDADYNNKIAVGGVDVYRSVVVWSCGTNRVDDGGTGDDVKSWE